MCWPSCAFHCPRAGGLARNIRRGQAQKSCSSRVVEACSELRPTISAAFDARAIVAGNWCQNTLSSWISSSSEDPYAQLSFRSFMLRPGLAKTAGSAFFVLMLRASTALAQPAPEAGGEANLKLPDLSQVNFLGMDGHKLLTIGILFCIFGLAFGLAIYVRLKNLPVHRAMLEISELIYETCKTYLVTQGKFLLLLESFIAVIIILYFGVLPKFRRQSRAARSFCGSASLALRVVMAWPGLVSG